MPSSSGQAGTPSPHFSPTQLAQVRAILDRVHGSNSQESLLESLEREYGLDKEGRQQITDTLKYHKDVEAFVGEWNEYVEKVESELHSVASALPSPQELEQIKKTLGLHANASLAEVDDANVALIEELVTESPNLLPKLAGRLQIVAQTMQEAADAARDHCHRVEHAFSSYRAESTRLLEERDQMIESRSVTFKSEALALRDMLSKAQAKAVEAAQRILDLEKEVKDAGKETEKERAEAFQAKRTATLRLDEIALNEKALNEATEENADLKKREKVALEKASEALKSLSEHINKHNAIQTELESLNSVLYDTQSRLEEKLSHKSDEVAGLEKDKNSLQKQLTARHQDVERLRSEEKSLQNTLNANKTQIGFLRSSKESFQGQLNGKVRELSRLQNEQGSLKQNLSEQEKELKRLAAAMKTASRELSAKEDARAAVVFENANLAEKLAGKDATIAQLRSERNKASRRASESAKRYANARSKNVALSTMLVTRRRQVVRLRHARSTLSTKGKLQSARIAGLENDCEDRSNTITRLESTLEDVESANVNLDTLITGLNSTVEDKNASIVALEQQIQGKNSELEDAQVTAAQLQSAHRNTRLRLMLANTNRDDVNARLESTGGQLSTALEQLSSSNQALAAKQAELLAVSDRLKTLADGDAEDQIIGQLIDDIGNKLRLADTTSSDLREALTAKEVEFKESLSAKSAELTDVVAAKNAELNDVLAAKDAELKDALAAKDTELKDALAAKASEYEGALAAKEAELKDALAAKASEYEGALAAKEAELKDALAAKASEYEGALAAKEAQLNEALAAKDSEFKDILASKYTSFDDALSAKASELEDVLAAKEQFAKQAGETQLVNHNLRTELAEKDKTLCAVRDHNACIPAYRDHIFSPGFHLASEEGDALDRSMSKSLELKNMLQVDFPGNLEAVVIHGAAGQPDMVSGAQLVDRFTAMFCQAHRTPVILKPEDMQLMGQSIFQSQDEAVVRRCVSLLYAMLHHACQTMESSNGFFHELSLLLGIDILSTFVRGDAVAEVNRLLAEINSALVHRSPLPMALVTSSKAKLSGTRVDVVAEVVTSARDLGIEVEVSGHSLHRADGNLVLVAKADPDGNRKLAIIRPKHCHVEVCALSGYRLVFTDAPVVGCWASPFWEDEEFEKIQPFAFSQLEERPLSE